MYDSTMITVDKDFLGKLEESLKKLAKQNEKVKQAVKDKEEFERQVEKLKHKVRLLKHDKSCPLTSSRQFGTHPSFGKSTTNTD